MEQEKQTNSKEFCNSETNNKVLEISEIMNSNPWIEVKKSLVGKPLYCEGEQFVCPIDKKIIEAYNQKYKGADFEFNLCVPPDPFVGDILGAKLIILSLNPGYIDKLNRRLALLFREDAQRKLINGKKEL